jgi:hypothetical protein
VETDVSSGDNNKKAAMAICRRRFQDAREPDQAVVARPSEELACASLLRSMAFIVAKLRS